MCEHCRQKNLANSDAFRGGSKVVLAGGAVVHAECQEAFEQVMGEPCAHCGDRLAGEFAVAHDGTKVHASCESAFCETTGLVCIQKLCGTQFERIWRGVRCEPGG